MQEKKVKLRAQQGHAAEELSSRAKTRSPHPKSCRKSHRERLEEA